MDSQNNHQLKGNQYMKLTFMSLLADAGLTFIGFGALLTTTPANAAIYRLTAVAGAITGGWL